MTMTPLDQLKLNGFVTLEREINDFQLEHLRTIIDCECLGEEWGDASKLSFVKDNHVALKALLSQIWPDGYITTTWSIRVAHPHSDDGDWHVDYPTHDLPQPFPNYIHGLQIVVSIDDFTLNNGATEVIPKTHTLNRWPDPHSIQTLNKQRIVIGAGTVALWDSRLWHRIVKNNSNTPRRSFVGSFANPQTPPKS